MDKRSRVRDAKLISIGNSKGIRIPKALLNKYGMSESLLLEETETGLLLRSKNDSKISWEESYKEISVEAEDWQDFDLTIFDGIGSLEYRI